MQDSHPSLNQLLGEMAAGLPAVPAGLQVVEATRFPKPILGAWLRFRYRPTRYPPADRPRFKHGFYDDFPSGRKVRWPESRVSLHADIQCPLDPVLRNP